MSKIRSIFKECNHDKTKILFFKFDSIKKVERQDL